MSDYTTAQIIDVLAWSIRMMRSGTKAKKAEMDLREPMLQAAIDIVLASRPPITSTPRFGPQLRR